MTDKCYAAIDLGTNSCRLLICDENGQELRKETTATRLGEGMHKDAKFTDEAIERGLRCFFEYKQLMDKYDIVKSRAIATASCRIAGNGEEFIKRVKQETNIKLEVIDGYEEARLNLKGALTNVLGRSEYVVLYDLGGGSTEITLATNCDNPQILHTISIPWGARNAAEAFDLVEYNAENIAKLQKEIKSYVDAFVANSYLDNYRDKVCFLATSSTPLRLASMIKDFGEYDRDKADGITVNVAELDKCVERVYNLTRAEMADDLYIGSKRSYIFLAACCIFKTIYDGLGAREVTASLKSAKDGIIAELIKSEQKNG